MMAHTGFEAFVNVIKLVFNVSLTLSKKVVLHSKVGPWPIPQKIRLKGFLGTNTKITKIRQLCRKKFYDFDTMMDFHGTDAIVSLVFTPIVVRRYSSSC
jgi:hypothetical protein